MSYCRWSSDDFNCDIYCYKDISGGFTTHIAELRHVGDGPVSQRELVPINHQDAGKTFNDKTIVGMLRRMERLKSEGLIVPDFVIESVREQIPSNYREDE